MLIVQLAQLDLHPFKKLLAKLRAGEVSSVDALHAFQYKALQVNPDLNCVVHVSYEITHHQFSQLSF